MQYLVEICDYCKYRKEKSVIQNGCRHAACMAFPDGIPFSLNLDEKERSKGCANGYKYEKGTKKYGAAKFL